jgi:hypothetical protein
MHIWLDLIFRELLFLALLAALGAAPATFLPGRYDGVARLALAPVLGLCVGVCLTVTLVYFFPASDTGWVLILFALTSLAVAIWSAGWTAPRSCRSVAWPSRRGAVQLAIVAIVMLVSLDFPLALRHTVGPEGGWAVADTAGYLSETNGEAHQSIRRAERNRVPFGDLGLYYWSAYAGGYQQLDISALEANTNQLLGLGSTDTDSPFLIAVLLIGALGVFAVVRGVARAPTWAAVVAGCLFGGPLFVELFMDGSQAAIAGCALLAPTVALGCDALWSRKLPALVLFALLIAGLQTVYPLFLPPIVIGSACAIAVMLLKSLLRERPSPDEVLLLIGRLALVCGLAAAFTPVAFARNVRYWTSLLNGSQSFVGLPTYLLPLNILPGWLLQTREFYGLVDLSNATVGQLVMGAVLPLLALVVIVFAARRYREVSVMLLVGAGASLLAYYTWSDRGCSYCVQRNLIPVAALAAPALGLGIAAIATLRWRGRTALAAAVGAVIIVAVGHEGLIERQRVANGSYLLDDPDRQAIAALPRNPPPVELEGFGEGPAPPMELPLVYNLVDEKGYGNVSLPTDRDDNHGLAYLGGLEPLGPAFKPDYGYVLTRLGGIATDRRVLARYGPIALEQRTHDLDATITGGVSVATVRADPTGTAWVNPGRPLHFMVVGGTRETEASLSLVFRTTVPVRLVKQAGVSAVKQPGSLRVCVQTLSSPPVREVGFQLAFVPQPAPLPSEPYADPLPPRGVRLVRMRVQAAPCSRVQ